MKHEEITKEVIRIFYKVYNTLGYGFLEKVYERAMMIEFEKSGLTYENQFPIKVYYEGVVVGDYIADFVVGGNVVVEIKASRELSVSDEAQLLNYLRATDKEIGLILNYGRQAKFKRKIFDRARV
ncbi:MAG: GxxExxY protein [Nanoarchaeota archaeon]|jgi:GxxExxY protein|nr:GxxExxY protein [Nanoarchaeota archaeon]